MSESDEYKGSPCKTSGFQEAVEIQVDTKNSFSPSMAEVIKDKYTVDGVVPDIAELMESAADDAEEIEEDVNGTDIRYIFPDDSTLRVKGTVSYVLVEEEPPLQAQLDQANDKIEMLRERAEIDKETIQTMRECMKKEVSLTFTACKEARDLKERNSQLREAMEVKHKKFNVALEELKGANTIIQSLQGKRGGKNKNRFNQIAKIMHYPECWDTTAYPLLDDAIREMFECDDCTHCEDEEEVPKKPSVEHTGEVGIFEYSESERERLCVHDVPGEEKPSESEIVRDLIESTEEDEDGIDESGIRCRRTTGKRGKRNHRL